jgi:hypothetical protein
VEAFIHVDHCIRADLVAAVVVPLLWLMDIRRWREELALPRVNVSPRLVDNGLKLEAPQQHAANSFRFRDSLHDEKDVANSLCRFRNSSHPDEMVAATSLNLPPIVGGSGIGVGIGYKERRVCTWARGGWALLTVTNVENKLLT